MSKEQSLVTIHLTNQNSYIATVEEFERFLASYEQSHQEPNPPALLKITLMTPGENVAIDPEGSFEAYINPATIALVDYL